MCECRRRIRAGAGGRAKVRIRICEAATTCFKNNSSKIFTCICMSANTGPTYICAEMNFSRIFPACIDFVRGGTVCNSPPCPSFPWFFGFSLFFVEKKTRIFVFCATKRDQMEKKTRKTPKKCRIPCFFEQKNKENPKKKQGFSYSNLSKKTRKKKTRKAT